MRIFAAPGGTWRLNSKYKNHSGKCIYCGCSESSANLTSEHIVPLGLGARSELYSASCGDCRDVTSAIETECMQGIYAPARAYLGIKGRKSRRPIESVPSIARPAKSEAPFRFVTIKKAEHHGAFSVPIFPERAKWMNGEDQSKNIKIAGISIYKFHNSISNMLRASKREVGYNFNASVIGRFFCKIAHAYAVAELQNQFVPILADVILGHIEACGYFGGQRRPTKVPELQRHTLRLERWMTPARGEFYVVGVRLFSDLGMPTYWVPVGYPLANE